MIHPRRFAPALIAIALVAVGGGCASERPPERHAELGDTTRVKVAAIDAVMREAGASRDVETGVVVGDAAEEAALVAGLNRAGRRVRAVPAQAGDGSPASAARETRAVETWEYSTSNLSLDGREATVWVSRRLPVGGPEVYEVELTRRDDGEWVADDVTARAKR
jgi:hypothetical protein